jgi:hypothetical protein
MIIGKVGPLEAAIAARGLVENRDMRLDPARTSPFSKKWEPVFAFKSATKQGPQTSQPSISAVP